MSVSLARRAACSTIVFRATFSSTTAVASTPRKHINLGTGVTEAGVFSDNKTVMASMTAAKFAEGLPEQPDVAVHSSRVIGILGQNPGRFTLRGTNTYLIGTGAARVLLDTGEGKSEYLAVLERVLQEQKAELQEVVITHHHMDHLGGVPGILDKFGAIPVRKLKTADTPFPDGFDELHDGDIIKTEGATLRIVFTPGHCSDHASVWLEEERAVFTGDCILGAGSTVFTDLLDYMNSLEALRKLSPMILYPGHGPVIADGLQKINEYIKHRQDREDQILAVLQAFPQGLTSVDIAKQMYLKEGIPDALLPAATNSVRLHCEKLLKQGKITTQTDTSAWLIAKL